jgi:oligoribonuclease
LSALSAQRSSRSRDRADRRQDARHLAWLDLEATGIDGGLDAILQVALVVTTPDLEPLEEFVCAVWQPENVLARMTRLARDLHTRSGVLERVRAAGADIVAAERQLLAVVAGWCPFPATLAGSVLDVKRRFLDRSMPALARYFGSRFVDVGTLRTLSRLWYPDAPPFTAPPDGPSSGSSGVRSRSSRTTAVPSSGGFDHGAAMPTSRPRLDAPLTFTSAARAIGWEPSSSGSYEAAGRLRRLVLRQERRLGRELTFRDRAGCARWVTLAELQRSVPAVREPRGDRLARELRSTFVAVESRLDERIRAELARRLEPLERELRQVRAEIAEFRRARQSDPPASRVRGAA